MSSFHMHKLLLKLCVSWITSVLQYISVLSHLSPLPFIITLYHNQLLQHSNDSASAIEYSQLFCGISGDTQDHRPLGMRVHVPARTFPCVHCCLSRADVRLKVFCYWHPLEELGKITQSKDVSLEAKAKIIHTLIFPVTMYKCKRQIVKKAGREKWIHLKYSVGGELYEYAGPPER